MTGHGKRLAALVTALTEARVNEKREAAKQTRISDQLKAQGEVWRQANEGLNAAQKAIDDYIRDNTMREAAAIIKEDTECP